MSPIFVPTRGRINKQVTLEYIPQAILVCPPEEVSEHQRFGRKAIACPVDGIARVRQWIVDHYPRCFMVDDDLRFYHRCDGLVKSSPDQVSDAFMIMDMWLDDFKHVCMSPRMFNNAKPKQWYDVVKANNVHGYNQITARFDDVELMEDYHVTLSLLEQGFANRGLYSHCWNQDQSGAPGGCSIYRDPAMQKRAADRLAELHPDVVEVVRKVSTSGRGAMNERWDVKISWRKAYDQAVRSSSRDD